MKSLTWRWHQFMSSAMAPAWRVDVRPVIVYPVVVTVGPAVEMYQQLARSDVGNSRDAYQHRIALVNGFQLHANFKAVRRMLQTQHKDVHPWSSCRTG